MYMEKRKIFGIFIGTVLVFTLLYLLYWRGLVSSTRFFDVDEFSYMHWTAQVARGEHMYTDFFSYFTPGFMWVFAPIFWIYGVSVNVFSAARTVSFVIFLGMLWSLGYLFGITRGWRWALLPVVILAFLPMPYDKFLEIRPDNLATLLGIIGVVGEVRAIRERKNVWWMVSGLAYGLSLFVLVKTLPFVIVGTIIAAFSKKLRVFTLPVIAPWFLFFLGAWISGTFGVMWYSLTRLPLEVYKTAVNYPMIPSLFFYPNADFYGGNGLTPGLLANHAIWILGVLAAAYRLVTPFRDGKKTRVYEELLIGSICFVSIFLYVKYYPLKHSQYLIPIAVFIAYYAGDALARFFDWLERAGGHTSLILVLAGFVYLVVTVTKDVNTPKLWVTNTPQMAELARMIKIIPPAARVVDLEGRMVFWRDGYPISSLPFDAFLSYVSRRPTPLSQYLSLHPVEYIYEGDSNRFITFTADDAAYIKDNYVAVAGFGGRLLKRL